MSELRSGVMKGMRDPELTIGELIDRLTRGNDPGMKVCARAALALLAAKAMADAAQNARNYIAETNTASRHPAIVESLDMCIAAFRAAGG